MANLKHIFRCILSCKCALYRKIGYQYKFLAFAGMPEINSTLKFNHSGCNFNLFHHSFYFWVPPRIYAGFALFILETKYLCYMMSKTQRARTANAYKYCSSAWRFCKKSLIEICVICALNTSQFSQHQQNHILYIPKIHKEGHTIKYMYMSMNEWMRLLPAGGGRQTLSESLINQSARPITILSRHGLCLARPGTLSHTHSVGCLCDEAKLCAACDALHHPNQRKHTTRPL